MQIRAHRYRSALEYTQAPGWKSGGTAVTQPSHAPMGQGVHLGTAQVELRIPALLTNVYIIVSYYITLPL